MFNMRPVQPQQLSLRSRFRFRCYKGISCFTQCCSNIDILLTPYDVLRLKRRLGLSSGEFLARYAVVKEDEKSSHPYAFLRMGPPPERLCPFLINAQEGCRVYSDRPVSCRYYPVGQGTAKVSTPEGKVEHEEFYFLVREEHCKGFLEDTDWSIASWKDDQEVSLYEAMNAQWKEILMRRNLPGVAELGEGKRAQFFMASYDLDAFKRYVFQSRFLQVFDLSREEVETLRRSEEELMKFGFRYLKFLLGLEQTLRVRQEVFKGRSPSDQGSS
jgi:hypothetical protein